MNELNYSVPVQFTLAFLDIRDDSLLSKLATEPMWHTFQYYEVGQCRNRHQEHHDEHAAHVTDHESILVTYNLKLLVQLNISLQFFVTKQKFVDVVCREQVKRNQGEETCEKFTYVSWVV